MARSLGYATIAALSVGMVWSAASASGIPVPAATYSQGVGVGGNDCTNCSPPGQTVSHKGAFTATIYPFPDGDWPGSYGTGNTLILPHFGPRLFASSRATGGAVEYTSVGTTSTAAITYYFQIVGPSSIPVPVDVSIHLKGAMHNLVNITHCSEFCDIPSSLTGQYALYQTGYSTTGLQQPFSFAWPYYTSRTDFAAIHWVDEETRSYTVQSSSPSAVVPAAQLYVSIAAYANSEDVGAPTADAHLSAVPHVAIHPGWVPPDGGTYTLTFSASIHQ